MLSDKQDDIEFVGEYQPQYAGSNVPNFLFCHMSSFFQPNSIQNTPYWKQAIYEWRVWRTTRKDVEDPSTVGGRPWPLLRKNQPNTQPMERVENSPVTQGLWCVTCSYSGLGLPLFQRHVVVLWIDVCSCPTVFKSGVDKLERLIRRLCLGRNVLARNITIPAMFSVTFLPEKDGNAHCMSFINICIVILWQCDWVTVL